MTHT